MKVETRAWVWAVAAIVQSGCNEHGAGIEPEFEASSVEVAASGERGAVEERAGTGGVGEPPCSHGTCEVGGPLSEECGPCAADICKVDPYCCFQRWDEQCVSEVAWVCSNGCEK